MAAFDTSRGNGGEVGVYWKAKQDPNFRGDDEDIAASWNCTVGSSELKRFEKDTSLEMVARSLIEQGLLFGNHAECANQYPDRATSSSLVLSASFLDNTDLPWDLRVSMDTTLIGPHEPIAMRSYLCRLNAAHVEQILAHINSISTHDQWCIGFHGELENRTVETAPRILEDYLNAMMMVGYGGSVSAYNTPGGKGPDPGVSTQGCSVRRTAVPWPVCSLVVVNSVLLLWMTSFLLYPSIRIKLISPKLTASEQSVRDTTPGELLGWERLFIEENRQREGRSGYSSRVEFSSWL